VDPKEKEKLVGKQLEELCDSIEELEEQELTGYQPAIDGYYDPYAGITFGSGKYSNTIVNSGAVSGGYTVTAGAGLSSATGIQWTTGTTAANNPWTTTTSTGRLNLEGEAADIVVNGVSLMEVLRDRLNVMIPNPELEKEWDQLRELGDQYRRLEKELKEKGDMWSKLKAMPPLPPL
jgi:hypothetical protein